MDDPGDLVVVERCSSAGQVGDVDHLADQVLVVLVLEDQSQSRRAVGQVGGDDLRSGAEKLAEHPCADAPVGAGDQEAMLDWRGICVITQTLG